MIEECPIRGSLIGEAGVLRPRVKNINNKGPAFSRLGLGLGLGGVQVEPIVTNTVV